MLTMTARVVTFAARRLAVNGRLVEIDLGSGFALYALNGALWLITPWGYVQMAANEQSIISTVPDPPKLRLSARRGGSLGGVSIGWLRGDDREIEYMVFQGKRDERFRDYDPDTDARAHVGEFTLHLLGPKLDGMTEDQAMRRICEGRHDGVRFDVPIHPVGGVRGSDGRVFHV